MKFDFTPDPKVLIALTRTPMQPLDALCELIDNAIDSFAAATIQGIKIDNPLIIINLPTKKQLSNRAGILRVQDNGPGMSAQDAEKAIRAGFSGNNPYDRLGLFGMGFNISTGKMGNTTTFMTARSGSKSYIKTIIDLEKINSTKNYSLDAEEIAKGDDVFSEESHGTIVEVSDWWPVGDANNGFIEKLVKYGVPTVRREIGRRYATILREGHMRILVDGEKCVPFEHCVWSEKRFVTKHGNNIPAKYTVDKIVGSSRRCAKCTAIVEEGVNVCPACGHTSFRTIEERVWGWVGIQRFDSETDYGIDLIRNGRAIRKSEKQAFFYYTDDLGNVIFDYPNDQQYGRIVGEIHLDHVPVDFMKTDFQRSSAEWVRAMSYLRGNSSLQPNKPGADQNTSILFKLYQGYRRVRTFGKSDMYMGRWNASAKKAVRIGRDVEEEYYKKFLAKEPGYYDDTEWWKLVEAAEEPPVAELVECPECGAQNLKEAAVCTVCGCILKGDKCINPDCQKIIPVSAETCPHCGMSQIPVIIEPWICDVCHTKNTADVKICSKCHNPRGTKDPLSKEVLLETSERVEELSDSALIISMADGSKNSPLSFDVYETHSSLIDPVAGEELPLRIFKNIGQITIFINKQHPMFSKCGIQPEVAIASEIAMYLYDERQNLSNYALHNLSNITWKILQKDWIELLDINETVALEKANEILDGIRSRLSSVLGAEASLYFDDLSVEQKKQFIDTLIKRNIGIDQIGILRDTGRYIQYVPFEFLLYLYQNTADSFFGGGIWTTKLASIEDGLIDKELVEHINVKIKQQYRNSLETVVYFARDKYDDELTLRQVLLAIEFLQNKLVE